MTKPLPLALILLLTCAAPVFAEGIVITPEVRYAGVDGDQDLFQAQHWMNRGLDAGIREFSFSDDNYRGWEVWSEGHAMPGNMDFAYELLATKPDWGYWRLDFKQFPKYYDSEGGVYPGFSQIPTADSGRNLRLDNGKLELEFGLTPPHLPDVAFLYEYEYKNGTKSRLSWASVVEGATTRKIGPSWQEIDEEVHVFELKASDVWWDTAWEIEQKWEHFQSRNVRNEQSLATTATASNYMIRNQVTEPIAYNIESVFEAERWIIKDKLYATAGYRFGQIEASEVENIYEMTRDSVPFNFSANAEQVREATASNQYKTNTAVASFLFQFWKNIAATVKLKAEDIERDSFSYYPKDKSPQPAAPNGVIDQLDWSNVEDDMYRFGEALSLRYTGIPRMALYNELELEQVDSDFTEDRTSGSASEVFNRFTAVKSYRYSETLGFNHYPFDFLKTKGHYRYQQDQIDYDDERETTPTATGAKSAFFDAEMNETHELSLSSTLNLWHWIQPQARYRVRYQDIKTQTEQSELNVSSETVAHIITFDLPFQPLPNVNALLSHSIQNAYTNTAAREAPTITIPSFDSDVQISTAAVDWAVNDKLTVNTTASYQTADNYGDFLTPLSYGADYEMTDVTVGLKWSGFRNWVIEPTYAYSQYDPYENFQADGYDAHIVWVKVEIPWS